MKIIRLPVLALTILATVAPLARAAFHTPVSYDEADRRAGEILGKMTLVQKCQMIHGYKSFFSRGFPELGVPELYMADSTPGVHIRRQLSNALEKSTAFPSPLALAATWDPELAYAVARSIGEECRAGGIAFLLGPGMNMYRQSQCGRNFEYLGEDPFLVSRLVERYVAGVLATGTIPTLKHFIGNETDHYRRRSNSVIDERALHEIYLPPFKAGIDAGAPAIMTAYNQLNGEWCGQNRTLLTDILRGELGYRGMVMSDWRSVWDAKKFIESGQDLEMPGSKTLPGDVERLLQTGEISETQIDRMVRNILRTGISLGLYDRPVKDESFLGKYPEHEAVALQNARAGIVLLKNDGVLPLPRSPGRNILLTGRFVEKIPLGGGAAEVEGYNNITLLQALTDAYGDELQYVAQPTVEQLKAADIVFVSTGTLDHESWDRPFALPPDEEARVVQAVTANPRTVVIVNSGGGIQMTGWNDRAAAVLYAWYPGQIGNRALAEILTGEINPSGKLPITLEKQFQDSPGCGYLPTGDQVGPFPKGTREEDHPVYPINYAEGVFIGYRWYEHKKIAPLYAFGHGLSYTTFAYSGLKIFPTRSSLSGTIEVEFTVKNTGSRAGAEIAQVYVRDAHAAVSRPEKELKGFGKVTLSPGESKVVKVALNPNDFAYWDVATHAWKAELHDYTILVGRASDRIELQGKVTLR